jgi:hypothetical protein
MEQRAWGMEHGAWGMEQRTCIKITNWQLVKPSDRDGTEPVKITETIERRALPEG